MLCPPPGVDEDVADDTERAEETAPTSVGLNNQLTECAENAHTHDVFVVHVGEYTHSLLCVCLSSTSNPVR